MQVKNIHIIMYVCYALLFIILVVTAVLSTLEIWPFNVYQRKYSPPGVSTGENKSPYLPN